VELEHADEGGFGIHLSILLREALKSKLIRRLVL